MGYDYHARKPATPRPEWKAGGDNTEFSAWFDDPRNYLRRNIWGANSLADAMIKLGMAYSVEQSPRFPDPDDYGVISWNDEGEPVGQRAEEYQSAVNEVLAQHPLDSLGTADVPGVPVHKICGSNDGWHVTAQECQQALDVYRKRMAEGDQHPESFCDDVIPFLEACAQGDGFETH